MEPMRRFADIEEWLQFQLPEEYMQFLLDYKERIFGDHVLLYAAEDLIERNSCYETKVYCPGYLAIGDDSGGIAFVIPCENWTGSVFAVGQGDMTKEGFTLVATDFGDWIRGNCPLP